MRVDVELETRFSSKLHGGHWKGDSINLMMELTDHLKRANGKTTTAVLVLFTDEYLRLMLVENSFQNSS